MAKLISTAMTSLDGYVADTEGNFDWHPMDAELHQYINDTLRPVGTYLLGRRMYESMLYWENPPAADMEPDYMRDYAEMWRGVDKIVYSTTLAAPSSARTRIERSFDAEAVRELKSSSAHDLSISGPHLAAHALRAGLVDEVHLYVAPVIVGGGNASLPDGLRADLTLRQEQRFANGVVLISYGIGR